MMEKYTVKDIIKEAKRVSLDELDDLCMYEGNDNPNNHKIVTKTYGVILTNSDMALSNERVERLRNKLNKIIEQDSYWMAANYTPYNAVCGFSLVIYAINRNEETCGRIIERVEGLLTGMDLSYERFVTKLSWDDDGIFIEIKEPQKQA